MKLPPFLSRKKIEAISKEDEQVFAEAKELALLRLEQSIADLRIWTPTNQMPGPDRIGQQRKFSNPS